jgi:hypothetical protein
MAKSKQSFSDAILDEPARFLKYVDFSQVKDFGDFDNLFREAFDTSNGANANIDSSDMIALFETPECKALMKEQVSKKEYDDIFGDGKLVERFPTSRRNQVVTITAEKVSVKSHVWKGKSIKPYNKAKPRPFSNAEVKFIQVRKQKGIKPSRIIKDYNAHFSKNPRTPSSIRTKSYRL